MIITAFVLMFLSLVLVIFSVFSTEKAIATTTFEDQDQEVPTSDSSKKVAFENTRSTLYVALMYILAFFLTWIWTVIAVLFGSLIENNAFAWSIIDRSKLIFTPLQGFFNALIFFYQKLYFLRKRDTSLTWFQALKHLLVKPKDDREVIFSSLSKVDKEIEEHRHDEEIQKRIREEEEKDDVEREQMERENEIMFEDDMLMSYPSRETKSKSSEFLSFASRNDSNFDVSTNSGVSSVMSLSKKSQTSSRTKSSRMLSGTSEES